MDEPGNTNGGLNHWLDVVWRLGEVVQPRRKRGIVVINVSYVSIIYKPMF